MMEHAYRTVNKLWDRSQPLDIEIEKPDPAYYDFVNDYPANDETMLAAARRPSMRSTTSRCI